MTTGAKQAVHWLGWFGWFTEKLEAWLEARAANGWHLVKADRLLNRFHFRQGPAKQVRVCVDFPAKADDEYTTIFADAGWELAVRGLGWYIWRAEYSGDKRPEAFNDPQGLIERNTRMAIILGGALLALLAQIPIQGSFSAATRPILSSPFGAFLHVVYVLLIAVLSISIALTLAQIRKLKDRNPRG